MPKKLIVENLSKSYESNRWIIQNLSFSVESGKVIGIIGNKGAGKSTLLKILGRVIYPTSGRAIINGRVAALFEPGHTILRHLTGRENILFNAAFYGIAITKILKKFDSIIALADIENSIDLPVKRYSIEMYLRLAWSIVVHLEPDVLLLDETIDLGDREFQDRCFKYIKEASNRGMTILFASKHLEALEQECDLCIWLDEGKIIEFASPEKVILNYQNYWRDRPKITPTKIPKKSKINSWKTSNVLENELGKIISVQLLSAEKKEVEEIAISSELCIYLAFETFIDAKIVIKIDIFSDLVHVLRTALPPKAIEDKRPGAYESYVRIPNFLLAERIYSIDVWLLLRGKNGEQNPLVYRKAITFQVKDRGEGEICRGLHKTAVPWIISPLLQWELIQKSVDFSDD